VAEDAGGILKLSTSAKLLSDFGWSSWKRMAVITVKLAQINLSLYTP